MKKSMHPDEREDKALIKKMVKPEDLKKGGGKAPPKQKERQK